jgi:hypothetical protein
MALRKFKTDLYKLPCCKSPINLEQRKDIEFFNIWCPACSDTVKIKNKNFGVVDGNNNEELS